MKSLFLIFSIVFLSFLVLAPTSTSATSGACSYHNGVNCSIGGGNTGNVTCNDGWVNSSVLFSNTDECKIVDSCPNIIYGLVCIDESSYDRLKEQNTNRLGSTISSEYRSGAANSTFGNAQIDRVNNANQAALDNCRKEINLYNAMVASRDQCENQLAEKQSAILSQQVQNNEIQNRSKLNAICVQSNGIGSVWIWNGNFPTGNFADIISTQCTQGRDARIDAAFQKYFKLAMDILPEYKGIVDPTIIKALSLDPANANKTFIQIITERYPDVTKPTSTLTTYPLVASSTALSIPSASVNVFAINQNIRVGASGNDVISLQKFLEGKGFLTLPDGTVEGYFGNLTKQALILFQKSLGLPATGYCGPMTRAKIK